MKRLDPITLVFLALAGMWTMAQFFMAFFVHVTERAKPTGSGWVVPPTNTYMQAYGLSEVVFTALVLGVVAFVGFEIFRRRRRGHPGAGALAWGLSVATLMFGVLGSGTCWASRSSSVWRARPSVARLRQDPGSSRRRGQPLRVEPDVLPPARWSARRHAKN